MTRRLRFTNAPAPAPLTAEEVAEREEMRRSDVELWHHRIAQVVEAAVAYRAEEGRDDHLHPARQSKKWGELWDSITRAYEAHRGIDAPVTVLDIELDRRAREIARKMGKRRRP